MNSLQRYIDRKHDVPSVVNSPHTSCIFGNSCTNYK